MVVARPYASADMVYYGQSRSECQHEGLQVCHRSCVWAQLDDHDISCAITRHGRGQQLAGRILHVLCMAASQSASSLGLESKHAVHVQLSYGLWVH